MLEISIAAWESVNVELIFQTSYPITPNSKLLDLHAWQMWFIFAIEIS